MKPATAFRVPSRDLTRPSFVTLTDVGEWLRRSAWIILGLGAVLLGVGFIRHPAHGWANLLAAAYNLTTVGLGGLFLLAIQSLTGARWSDPILKAHRALPSLLPVAAVMMLLLWFGAEHLYPWARPEAASDPFLHGRLVWLNRPFFFGRALLFFGLWIGLGRRLVNQGRGAAPFILVFGVTFSLVNFDWIMSLEPVWSSTLMAIYGFSGMFLQGIALVTLTAILLRRIGVLPSITKAQNHDLGKLLFAFSAFWGYIWLCQFLLVWYANLPEETGPLQRMMALPWSPLFYLNVGLNFVLPFLLLLRRKAKEHEGILALASLLALAGHWLDVYLMVIPPVMGGVFPPVGLPELGGLLLQFGLAHMVCWPVFVHRVDPDQAVPLAE